MTAGPHSPPRIDSLESGTEAGRGNLLGLQPRLLAADYATEAGFYARLAAGLAEAQRRGWLGEQTVVVLPEYLGTWLAVTGEGRGVLAAGSVEAAMRALVLRHPLRFVRALRASREHDRLRAALFRMQAEHMAGAYQRVFSRLAQQHGVTLVAGSILLPGPSVRAGVVRVGPGPLQNVTAVFQPDGRAHPALARKVFPTLAELPFVSGAALEALPVFETPAGRLGVLVCADSWHPTAYARLKAQAVDLLAVPSAILTRGLWTQPWAGYDGAAPPSDVDPRDVGVLTEGQAWRKYALAGRLGLSGARYGLNVFLRGQLWDMHTDGRSLGLAPGRPALEAPGDGATLLNVWL
jgi:predicted amidohydrolase